MRKLKAMLTGMHWFPNVPGGLNRYFHGLVHALPKATLCGHALVAAVQSGQSSPLDLLGFARQDDSIVRQLIGARRVARGVLSSGVDLANSHFAKFAYPWISLLPSGSPLIVHFHGPWADEMAVEGQSLPHRLSIIMARHMEQAVYRRATLCITLSDGFRDVLHERFNIPLERIRVVPGGVDLDYFMQAPDRADARRRLGWPEDRPIFVTVRRQMKRMGLEMLLEAFQQLSKSHPSALLMIAGTGPLAGALDAQILELGISDRVRRLGRVPDEQLPSLYAAADCTLVPSIALEGFGLTTVESMAAGTPVLGTAIGGTPEVLRPFAPQLLFESPTANAIASHLALVLDRRLDLPDRAACRDYVQRFAWSDIVMQVREVYDEAMAAAGP